MLLDFNEAAIGGKLAAMSPSELDTLVFGVIGMDAQTIVRSYNEYESKTAGLAAARVLGQPLFTHVAPCMNNFLVAQRFEDTASAGARLDETIDYVLTLRMRPIKVKLRLIAQPEHPLRYILVARAA
jgi:photoactive yellow protein